MAFGTNKVNKHLREEVTSTINTLIEHLYQQWSCFRFKNFDGIRKRVIRRVVSPVFCLKVREKVKFNESKSESEFIFLNIPIMANHQEGQRQ